MKLKCTATEGRRVFGHGQVKYGQTIDLPAEMAQLCMEANPEAWETVKATEKKTKPKQGGL